MTLGITLVRLQSAGISPTAMPFEQHPIDVLHCRPRFPGIHGRLVEPEEYALAMDLIGRHPLGASTTAARHGERSEGG